LDEVTVSPLRVARCRWGPAVFADQSMPTRAADSFRCAGSERSAQPNRGQRRRVAGSGRSHPGDRQPAGPCVFQARQSEVVVLAFPASDSGTTTSEPI